MTVRFSEEAVAAREAAPRTARDGQPSCSASALAIAAASTLRAVFRLALRRTEGPIASILRPLGLDLTVPDHATLSRRAETLEVPRPATGSSEESTHLLADSTGLKLLLADSTGLKLLLVDSTGLKLCGPGEWLVERHGTRTRRGRRKPHLATDADTGRIVASALTGHDADDGPRAGPGSQVGPPLDRVDGPVASLAADGAFDRDDVCAEVAARHPEAEVMVPPRSGAVPSATAETAPTRRDRHIAAIAERGRMGRQKASGHDWRALVEAGISRFKRVIGGVLHSRTDGRRATEVAIATVVLSRMLDPGRPEYVRPA